MYIKHDPILGEVEFRRCNKLVCVMDKVDGKHVTTMAKGQRLEALKEISKQLEEQDLVPTEYDNDHDFLSIVWDLPADWFDAQNETYRESYIVALERTMQDVMGNPVDIFELDHEDFAA